MTPQEKANELFHKFYLINSELVELETGENDLVFSLSADDAKKCALMAVEEILPLSSPYTIVYHYTQDGATILNQWPERVFWFWVKIELEKL